MGKAKTSRHVLDGEYIIYNYMTQDHADESSALALYRLSNNKMETVYHPADYEWGASDIGEHSNDKLLELMKARGITRVYSVHHVEDFFGIPAGFISLHEDDEEIDVIDLWAEWDSLNEGDENHQRLSEAGIEVLFHGEY